MSPRSSKWAILPLICILASPVAASADGPVQVLDVDSYSKQVGPGASVPFMWTLRNVDPLNITYRVELGPSGLTTGWTASFDRPNVTLDYRGAVSVTLSLTAPQVSAGL